MGFKMFVSKKLLVFILGFVCISILNLQARDLSSKEVTNLVRYSRSPVGLYEQPSFGYPFQATAFGDWPNHGYARADSGMYGEFFDIGW